MCFLSSALSVSALAGEGYQITATIQSLEPQYCAIIGCSVAVSEDVVVVGDYWADVEGKSRAGKAHIYGLDGNLKVTLQSPTPLASGQFGKSIAIRGDIILVAEPGADIDDKTGAGKVYIYNSDGSLQATIQSPTPKSQNDIGWYLCFIEDTIAVEESFADVEDMPRAGKVHLYDSDGDFLESLQSPEPYARGLFGFPVDGRKDSIVVGEGYYKQTIKAYLFDSNGDFLTTLQSPEPQIDGFFGLSLTVSGDIIVVGEYRADVEGNSRAGKAHIFDADGNFLTSLQSPEPEAGAMFGWSVDTDGVLVLVGEPNSNGESFDEGKAYVFDPDGNLLEILNSPEPTLGSEFGNSVLVEGEIIVVGELGSSDVGRVFVFQAGTVDFTLSGLTINPSSVNVGGSVTVSVECCNEGSLSGSSTVTMMIDGEVEDEETVTLAPDESTTISFDAPTSEKGTYSVEIEGLTGNYKVEGGILGFPVESLIAGLAVAILVLWARQRSS
jgi:catechol 2,3-dioxygenase-like lactoylglutathione lyase family enzyme